MINKAKWICSPETAGERCFEFVKKIPLAKKVSRATLYISSIGVYYCTVNGREVTDSVLNPGWTNYFDHTQYQEYDVTHLMETDSELRVLLGNGWGLGPTIEMKKIYSEKLLCIFALDIKYADNTEELIISDKNTDVYTSQTRFAEHYNGETIDRTYIPVCLGKAEETSHQTKLVPQLGEWIKEQETLFPAALITTPKGEKVIDFGQNMTGYVSVKLKKGEKIALSYAEVFDKDGNFYTGNYRTAQNKICYIAGDKDEEFKPRLTFQGFRYVRIDEYSGEINLNNFKAIEVHSELRRTGEFVCGNDKINRLYSNMLWGHKDNYLDIPTDCPQRDERLGWMADTQVFARTAAINFDVRKFFDKWLYDVRTEQAPDGSLPAVVPAQVNIDTFPMSAAWADAAVICPWEMYRAYGDIKVLEENFDCMKRWIEYMHSAGDEEYLWLAGNHFGDWLSLDAPEGTRRGGTDPDLIASCFFAYSTSLFIKSGKILGKDMSCYEDMLEKVKAAVRERFTKDSLPLSRTQTACVLLIQFDITDNYDAVADLLVKLIMERDTSLATGFVGTPYLLHSLTKAGRTDLAYELLLREKYPSWLYSVNNGATTIWEHWDSLKEDGSFWDDAMNSFNHYAYGAVFDWVYAVPAGINIADGGEGYKKVVLSPVPDKRLGFVKASIETNYGKLSSSWRYQDDYIRYEFDIPEGISATVRLSEDEEIPVGNGRFVFFKKQ